MRSIPGTATSLALVAAALAAGSARAAWTLGNGDTVNLADVMAGDRTVFIDDKMFYFESFTTAHFDASDITLVGFISYNTNGYGFRNVGFDLFGGFGDARPGDGTIAEANLQYTVSVNADAYAWGLRLCDARLTFNGSAYGEGAFSRVDETIFDLDANVLLGNLNVYDNFGPPRSTRLTDYRDFCEEGMLEGYRAFEVNKDLKFLSPTEADASSASFIRQEFSQVPGPGALALLGLAGFVGRRRRQA